MNIENDVVEGINPDAEEAPRTGRGAGNDPAGSTGYPAEGVTNANSFGAACETLDRSAGSRFTSHSSAVDPNDATPAEVATNTVAPDERMAGIVAR